MEVSFRSPEDKAAVTTGMVLHALARRQLASEKLADACCTLELSLEAFDTACMEDVKKTDNAGLAALDYVWCLFHLQNTAKLEAAAHRLRAARAVLARAHAGRELQPREIAAQCRLELLEGVAAYLGGDAQAARASLLLARQHGTQLTVSPEAAQQLVELGLTAHEARMALLSTDGVPEAAVEWAYARRAEAAAREAANRAERRRARELKRLGLTRAGRPLDGAVLDQLCGLGYESQLSATALRNSNNDLGGALDLLSSEETHAALQAQLAQEDDEKQARKRRRSEATSEALATLTALGFDEGECRRALARCDGDANAAAELLLSGGELVDEAEEGGEAEERDAEAEAELAGAVGEAEEGGLEVTLEMAAIAEYMGRL